jgi:hypothetical protein
MLNVFFANHMLEIEYVDLAGIFDWRDGPLAVGGSESARREEEGEVRR